LKNYSIRNKNNFSCHFWKIFKTLSVSSARNVVQRAALIGVFV
jgi:hypothetical protein